MTFNEFIEASEELKDARDFCRQAHDSIGQKRKYSGEPYWHHTEKVAELVYGFCHDKVSQPLLNQMIKAAAAHDLIEDITPCNPTYSEDYIFSKLGIESFAMVKDLTDVFTKENFPGKNRASRKELEANRLSMIPTASKIIKLCDMLDNTKDITSQDKGFAKVYISEKLVILKLMYDVEYAKEKGDMYDIFRSIFGQCLLRAVNFIEFQLDSSGK